MVEIDNNNEQLQEHLRNLLDIDLYSRRIVSACPHCNSNRFIKHGTYQKKQRYLCKSCRKTFCKRTNTLLYRTKKYSVLWVQFINLMLSKRSLRESSLKLNIALSTTFIWRHKILHSLAKLKEPVVLESSINMMKIFTKENYKGDRNAPLEERRKVWTVVAQDANEAILASPISIGNWDRNNFDKIIYSKINDKSYLNTFCDRYLYNVAKEHNKLFKKEKYNVHETALWRYITEVKGSLIRFNGVATKYLKRYLYFSTIFSVEGKYEPTSLMYKLIGIDAYIMYKDLKDVPIILLQ